MVLAHRGVNVVAVGIGAYLVAATDALAFILLAVGTVATFAAFFFRIFRPYADKHARRIEVMGAGGMSATRSKDAKGCLMIAFMIALGAGLRLLAREKVNQRGYSLLVHRELFPMGVFRLSRGFPP